MDSKTALEFMGLIRENSECLRALHNQIGEVVMGLLDAADHMVVRLGQNPDAPPLPAVELFFARVRADRESLKEISDTIFLVASNHTRMAETIVAQTPIQ